MYQLNLPTYQFKFKKKQDKTYIFDIIRRKYYVLTPEEWVRQHIIHYLIFEKNYPKTLIAVEKQISINTVNRRFDIVVFNKNMKAEILVECKAPKININQKTFDQANQYNWLLKAPYLFLTNGLKHYICEINFDQNNFRFLKELPIYK
jgi:type I site-specific restriction endonuclease